MSVGAYTVAVLEIRLGTPFLLNLLVGAALAALLGILVGIPSLR